MNKLITGKKDIMNVLSSLVDSVELRDDCVYINTSKDIFIKSRGNFVLANKGLQVFISPQLHLNPNIEPSDNIDDMKDSIEKSLEQPKNIFEDFSDSEIKLYNEISCKNR